MNGTTGEAAEIRVAVVRSRFNRVVTDRLLEGSMVGLGKRGVDLARVEVVDVPGAFEIPLAVKWFLRRGAIDAIICLGAVIRGETPHFDFISQAVVSELCGLSVRENLPITLGVLTTNDIEQALARTAAGPGNKGHEAAVAAVEMVLLRRKLEELGSGRT